MHVAHHRSGAMYSRTRIFDCGLARAGELGDASVDCMDSLLKFCPTHLATYPKCLLCVCDLPPFISLSFRIELSNMLLESVLSLIRSVHEGGIKILFHIAWQCMASLNLIFLINMIVLHTLLVQWSTWMVMSPSKSTGAVIQRIRDQRLWLCIFLGPMLSYASIYSPSQLPLHSLAQKAWTRLASNLPTPSNLYMDGVDIKRGVQWCKSETSVCPRQYVCVL